MIPNNLNGILFSSYNEEEKSLFEKLLSIFKVNYTPLEM